MDWMNWQRRIGYHSGVLYLAILLSFSFSERFFKVCYFVAMNVKFKVLT